MKAIHTETLAITEAPMPVLKPTQVLIEVKAMSLNRADLVQRQGNYPPPTGESTILGLEVAGIVQQIGADVKHYNIGDHVMALLGGGGYAQYVAVDEGLAMKIPRGMSFVQAAAIPEAFLTAHQALVWLAKLQPQEWLLIHAGGSGVGTAAIQLAKQLQAKIAITAGSEEKIAKCLALGAHVGINYKTQDFAQEILLHTEKAGTNVAIDVIGAPYTAQHFKCLAPDARWIVLAFMAGAKGAELDFPRLLIKRIQLQGSTLRSRPLAYRQELVADFSKKYLPMFSTALLYPVIDSVWSWSQAAQAHEYMEQNKNFGKIVMSID